jgi:hypothetical protein
MPAYDMPLVRKYDMRDTDILPVAVHNYGLILPAPVALILPTRAASSRVTEPANASARGRKGRVNQTDFLLAARSR